MIELKEREDQIVQLQKSLAELRDMFQAFTEALSLQEECIQTIEDTLQKTKVRIAELLNIIIISEAPQFKIICVCCMCVSIDVRRP